MPEHSSRSDRRDGATIPRQRSTWLRALCGWTHLLRFLCYCLVYFSVVVPACGGAATPAMAVHTIPHCVANCVDVRYRAVAISSEAVRLTGPRCRRSWSGTTVEPSAPAPKGVDPPQEICWSGMSVEARPPAPKGVDPPQEISWSGMAVEIRSPAPKGADPPQEICWSGMSVEARPPAPKGVDPPEEISCARMPSVEFAAPVLKGVDPPEAIWFCLAFVVRNIWFYCCLTALLMRRRSRSGIAMVRRIKGRRCSWAGNAWRTRRCSVRWPSCRSSGARYPPGNVASDAAHCSTVAKQLMGPLGVPVSGGSGAVVRCRRLVRALRWMLLSFYALNWMGNTVTFQYLAAADQGCYFARCCRIGEAVNPGPCPRGMMQLPSIDDADGEHLSEDSAADDDFGHAPVAADHVEADVPLFLKAKKFQGAKTGYYFSTGLHGLGYYRDVGLQQPEQLGVDPVAAMQVRINLVSLLADPGMVAPQPLVDPGVAATPSSRRRRRHDRTARKDGPLSAAKFSKLDASDQARSLQRYDDLKHQCDNIQGASGMACSEVRHRDMGLWAFDTLNPNAWTGFVDYLRDTSADFAACQEAKLATSDQIASAEASLRTLKWSGKVHRCGHGLGGGASAGTAVVARQHVGMSPVDVMPAAEIQHRFQLQHVGAVCKGGLFFGSVYLYDTCGPTAKKNRELLEAVASVLSCLNGPWIIAGDFNCLPEALEDTGFLQLVGGVIHCPADVTCGDKVYDYFIVSKDLSEFVHDTVVVSDRFYSPHSPVRLLLRAAPRSMLVQVLKAPKGFPAVLPLGPKTLQDHQEAVTACDIGRADSISELQVDHEFPKLLQLVESQLSSVAGLSQREAAGHSGRIDGPRLVRQSALSKQAGVAHQSGASRAWASTAKWLRRLQSLPASSVGALRLRRAVLRHPHRLGNGDDDLAFQLWRGSITHGMLQDASVVEALTGAACVTAKRLHQASVSWSLQCWQAWLQGGPAAGLARQHRMSRTAIGWIPAVKMDSERLPNGSVIQHWDE